MKCQYCDKELTSDQIRRKGTNRSKAKYCSISCANKSIKRKKLTTTPEERFMSKVTKTKDCWEWNGAKMPSGYGRFGYTTSEGKLINTYAHRISYLFFKGELTKGLVIDHLCNNRGCVNPDHLELVTQKENLKRSDKVISKIKTHCIHGHPFNKENTYYWNGEKRCRACGRMRKRKGYKRERD